METPWKAGGLDSTAKELFKAEHGGGRELGNFWNPSLNDKPSATALKLALTRPRRVLDVGCGDGRNMVPFVDFADEIVGVDPDERALVAAARRIGSDNVKFLPMQLPRVTLDASFDLVMCFGVLHFLSESTRPSALNNLAALTGRGGLLSINAFNARLPIPPDLQDLMPSPAPDSGELLRYFSSWSLVDLKSEIYEDWHDNGRVHHQHSIDRITVRRPL